MVIKADALHYKSDLLSNGVILLSLLGILGFDMHILDALLGVVMAFYLGYSALSLIREGSAILLDCAMPKEIVQEIRAIISAHSAVRAFHGLRTREAGNDYFVEVHLVFEQNIMLYDVHSASDEVEMAICALDSTKRWNLTIHLDPYDDSIKRKKS